jgi:hypothetical protein
LSLQYYKGDEAKYGYDKYNKKDEVSPALRVVAG